MFCAGYLLVGGRSSRMGVDKALLTAGEGTMASLLADRLSSVTGRATILIGDIGKYVHLGRQVIPDLRPGEGPLAGIEAALRHSSEEWSFILGCDMPGVPQPFLSDLARRAATSASWAIVPEPAAGGLEPLCAVYRKACLPAVTEALNDGRRRVKDLLATLPLERVTGCERRWFENLNTPADWDRYQASLAPA